MKAVAAREPQADQGALGKTCRYLREAYHRAAEQVDRTGFRSWRRGIIHGDWHPGNLLYENGTIVGVLDFDSARIEPRCVDIANASLQFSMTMGDPDDPGSVDPKSQSMIRRCVPDDNRPSTYASVDWRVSKSKLMRFSVM